MKRLSAIAAGLLFIGFGLFGCMNQPYGESDAGWITLLDGTSLNGWNTIGDANWRAEDGVIIADKGGKGGGFLVSKNSYADFQIRDEFWVTSETNSGIFIRCSDAQNVGAVSAYEVNIWDTRPDPSYGTGAIVNVAKVSPMPKAGGQWNVYEITAKGTHLTVTLNGQRTVDVEDSKHDRGPIALQWGSSIVKFRKLQVRSI